MNDEMERIARAIRDLAIETGKPELVIVSALSDYGVLTLQQDMDMQSRFSST